MKYGFDAGAEPWTNLRHWQISQLLSTSVTSLYIVKGMIIIPTSRDGSKNENDVIHTQSLYQYFAPNESTVTDY